jgi:spermidine synthase
MTAPGISSNQSLSGTQRIAVFALFFASGFAGLVYEVLWMKELGLLFGNTAQAAATTLAAFFLGIAGGGLVFGRLAKRAKNPLRLYALLEVGVTLCALLYFVLLDLYYAVYGALFDGLHVAGTLFVTVKFLLALGVLLPPAFFMGGTLPVMSQFLVRQHDRIGVTASTLYAVNTWGAALGAFAAGFYLPRLLGFTNAYTTALAITAMVALLAGLLSRRLAMPPVTESPAIAAQASAPGTASNLQSWQIRMLALFSGFITLGLEVLWTRMFAQVMQNSVYTFSAILVVFLFALAAGAALARALAGSRLPQLHTLVVLMLAGGLLVGASPLVFNWMTDGMASFKTDAGWTIYIVNMFAANAIVILPAGILLGAVLPYLLKIAEHMQLSAGQTVGDLVAVNTVGAVLGSLAAGFVLLEFLGLWRSLQIMAAAYILLAAILMLKLPAYRTVWAGALAGSIAVVVTGLDATHLPLVSLDPEKKDEHLVELWEGSGATVAVVTRRDSLRIKVNNHYGLGGSGDHKNEERQSHLPLLIHPKPKSVFYLGMGTGITAGAALQHPGVDRVVVTEILPDVVKATRKHFAPWLHGLYEDPRATVIAEDGRNYLFGTNESYDVIIADLFIPWKAGTGSLYTKEHYENAKTRLNKNGLYAQWLPLFQLTRNEFDIIVRTMLDVFPQVTIWRSKFHHRVPIMLVAGHKDFSQLDMAAIETRLDQIRRDTPANASADAIGKEAVPAIPNHVLLHYAGNLTNLDDLFIDAPVNKDDLPIIEYDAPKSNLAVKAARKPWFTKNQLIEFYDLVLDLSPSESDPYLAKTEPRARSLPRAGFYLHSAKVYKVEGDRKSYNRSISAFNKLNIIN